MTFAQRDISSQLLLHADWPTHSWSRSRHHGNNVDKFPNVTFLMCLFCNILCFAIAIFDSKTCNTTPKRLRKDRAGKMRQDVRQYTLKGSV